MQEYIKKVGKNLLNTIQTEILSDENFTYIDSWLLEQDYSTRINLKENKEQYIPYVLVRPGTFKQEHKDSITERTQEYLIAVVIKDKEITGYEKIISIRNRIIDYFTENNYSTGDKSYKLKLDMSSDIDDNTTVGDYWGIHIKLSVSIPSLNNRSFLRKRNI